MNWCAVAVLVQLGSFPGTTFAAGKQEVRRASALTAPAESLSLGATLPGDRAAATEIAAPDPELSLHDQVQRSVLLTRPDLFIRASSIQPDPLKVFADRSDVPRQYLQESSYASRIFFTLCNSQGKLARMIYELDKLEGGEWSTHSDIFDAGNRGRGLGTLMYALSGHVMDQELGVVPVSNPRDPVNGRLRSQAATGVWKRLTRFGLAKEIGRTDDGVRYRFNLEAARRSPAFVDFARRVQIYKPKLERRP